MNKIIKNPTKNKGETMNQEEIIKTQLYEQFKEAARNQEQVFKKYAELKSRVDALPEKEIRNQIYEIYRRNTLAKDYSDAEERQEEIADLYLDDVCQILTEREILHKMIVNHQVNEIEKLFRDIQFDEELNDEHQAFLYAVKEQDKLMLELKAESEKAEYKQISTPVQAFLDAVKEQI